jgi:hypothetical protein
MKDHGLPVNEIPMTAGHDHRLLSPMAVAAPVTQMIMLHARSIKPLLIPYRKGSSSVLGRIVLVAVAVAAVSAFTVLQIMARSGRRRSPAARGRRSRAGYDWRTLPPRYDDDAGTGELPRADQDSYGPLWRYGSPPGYRRDYGPGHSPGPGPGYGAPPPRRVPADAPHDGSHEERTGGC